MARSPFTLAASVTAALPRAVVVGAGPLTERGTGRFDAAVVKLEDGRRGVVRMPATEDSARDLAAESRALVALTPGVRALLPFRAPEIWGETGSGAARVLVVDYLPGYRVEPPHVPKGAGIAPALGAALAAVHALPPSIVRTDGLPVRTPSQVRDDVARLLDRVESTRRAPEGLAERWRRAFEDDELWRFESAVVLGGATSSSFLLEDEGEGVRVTGVLEWSGLSVGDPAVDLRWLASAPEAADDVFSGYAADASRAPDGLVRERARLYAELEFARWLVHGVESGDETVIDDAVALLQALADGVRGDRLIPDTPVDVDSALAFAEQMPETDAAPVTSMQTDTYDPEMLSLFLAAERDRGRTGEDADAPDFGLDGLRSPEDTSTAPIDVVGFPIDRDDDPQGEDAADANASALEDEAERASRAALQWWNRDGESRVSSGG
ncbi:phosphotransferase [Microbacterium sp. RD1]|uniref:phosphotransferase n=1 Tax=Microbacterium sp. RD1 TaxID=3457313 RepID=UPI003FA6044D